MQNLDTHIDRIPPSRQLPPAPPLWQRRLAILWKWIRKAVLWGVIVLGIYFIVCTGIIISLSHYNPPITMVQLQRTVEAQLHGEEYQRRLYYRDLHRISDHLQHAVIAAEDTRFFQHTGVDFKELRKMLKAVEESGDNLRGASTITQQLVKNLFLFTYRSYFRKALEYPLTFMTELVLPKERILELYLNVVEWGPGIYGAEAGARYYYGMTARWLTRYQSARLAAILPDPLHRHPSAMDRYSGIILNRMESFGW